MHRCLKIDELLEMIADNLETEDDIVHMAYVCRTFSEPAINSLWSSLDGLAPLVKCLPEELLGYTTVNDRIILTIETVPSNQQWDRFRYYARRVKEFATSRLGYPEQPTYVASLQCFSVLQAHYPDPRLFPQLREFTILPRDTDVLPHASLFIQPSLIDLTIETIPHRDEVIKLLDLVASKSPNLEHLWALDCDDPSDADLCAAFNRTICSLDKLRGLYMGPQSDSAVLVHLALRPAFGCVNIGLTEDNCRALAKLAQSNTLFPQLISADITDWTGRADCTLMIACLRLLHSPTLTELTLRVYIPPSVAHLEELLSTICSLRFLVSVDLQFCQGDVPQDLSSYPTDGRILSILPKTLHYLDTVNIEGLPVNLTREFIADFALSRRPLQHLMFDDECFTTESSLLLEDLLPLFKSSPGLRKLQISIKPHQTWSAADRGSTSVVPLSELHSLGLGDSVVFPEESRQPVAVFMTMFCPKARLTGSYPSFSANGEACESQQAIMKRKAELVKENAMRVESTESSHAGGSI